MDAVSARTRRDDGGCLTAQGFTCATCGAYHAERPLDIRADLPDVVFALPEDERTSRVEEIGEDFCALDGERHFVRGLIEIPIRGLDRYFGYGVWVETSEAQWLRLGDTWDEPVLGEMFDGFLANELDGYPGTLNLRVSLRSRQQLPAVRIEDEHPLAREQRSGVSEERADELSAAILH